MGGVGVLGFPSGGGGVSAVGAHYHHHHHFVGMSGVPARNTPSGGATSPQLVPAKPIAQDLPYDLAEGLLPDTLYVDHSRARVFVPDGTSTGVELTKLGGTLNDADRLLPACLASSVAGYVRPTSLGVVNLQRPNVQRGLPSAKSDLSPLAPVRTLDSLLTPSADAPYRAVKLFVSLDAKAVPPIPPASIGSGEGAALRSVLSAPVPPPRLVETPVAPEESPFMCFMSSVFELVGRIRARVARVPGAQWLPYSIFPHDASGRPAVNPVGKYIVKLYVGGAWRAIMIDDMIPIDSAGRVLLPVIACRESAREEPLVPKAFEPYGVRTIAHSVAATDNEVTPPARDDAAGVAAPGGPYGGSSTVGVGGAAAGSTAQASTSSAALAVGGPSSTLIGGSAYSDGHSARDRSDSVMNTARRATRGGAASVAASVTNIGASLQQQQHQQQQQQQMNMPQTEAELNEIRALAARRAKGLLCMERVVKHRVISFYGSNDDAREYRETGTMPLPPLQLWPMLITKAVLKVFEVCGVAPTVGSTIVQMLTGLEPLIPVQPFPLYKPWTSTVHESKVVDGSAVNLLACGEYDDSATSEEGDSDESGGATGTIGDDAQVVWEHLRGAVPQRLNQDTIMHMANVEKNLCDIFSLLDVSKEERFVERKEAVAPMAGDGGGVGPGDGGGMGPGAAGTSHAGPTSAAMMGASVGGNNIVAAGMSFAGLQSQQMLPSIKGRRNRGKTAAEMGVGASTAGGIGGPLAGRSTIGLGVSSAGTPGTGMQGGGHLGIWWNDHCDWCWCYWQWWA